MTLRIPVEFDFFPVVNGLTKMPRLTATEKRVLDCVLEGMSNKELAAKIGVCERTAKFHVSSLLRQFKVQSRYDLQQRLTLAANGLSLAPAKETLPCR